MSDWQTNISHHDAAAWLKEAGRVTLLTHTKPDGDAIGSTLALARSLQIAGIDATPTYAGAAPAWLNEFAGETPTQSLDEGADPAGIIGTPDAITILDTGTWTQLREFEAWLQDRAAHTLVMDHHLHGDPEIADRRIVTTSAAAACEVVAPVCCALIGVETPASLPIEIATPLYLGLGTDTGWFRHSNVTANVMTLASALLSAGVQPAGLFQMVELQDRPPRLRLLGRALSSLSLHNEDRIAVMTLTEQDFADCEGSRADTGGFADAVQSIGTVRVSAILTAEPGGDSTKISFRSKAVDDPVDVNEVARTLGGGGHARAAGARVAAPIDQARSAVLKALGASGG